MQIIGVARLGRDAELRHTQNGDAVASLSLAFNYGRKGADGNKPTQWVEGSLWGKQAEALAQYLPKGQQVYVVMDDPHIETFQGRSGEGHKLVGRISSIELVGGRPQGQEPARAPAPAPRPKAAPASGFDDMDDDIPF